MTEVELLKQRVGMIGIVSAQWFAVASAPFVQFMDLGRDTGLIVTVMAIVVAYCFFTGYRAWKRGWKARFYLRLVIPACLFVLACVIRVTMLLVGFPAPT